VGPLDPNWRPDTTGRRLATIRVARRGALLAATVFAPIGLLATSFLPTVEPTGAPVGAVGIAALAGLAGVALLGAGLAPAALGSRIDAVAVGVALAIGVPVAAVTSALIGTFMSGSLLGGFDEGAALAGQMLRAGVTDATRTAPLVIAAATVWVLVVRRWGTLAGSEDQSVTS
jgi:hypothetical protein